MRGPKLRREPSVYDGIDDPNELARALIENGDAGNPDPEIEVVQRRAIVGGGEHSERLKAMIGAPKSRPMKRRAASFERTQKFHPALK